MSNTDTNSDAEDLIAGRAPTDRERFRREAEATLALSPHMLGPGSIYRALVPVWRKFLHPMRDDRCTGWNRDRQRYSNNLIEAPATEDGRTYRHLRIFQRPHRATRDPCGGG